MSIRDRYVAPDTRPAFEKWLDTLTETNRAVVDAWLHDPNIANNRIVEMIREDDADDDFTGYRANKDAIAAYRRKLRGA